MDRYNNREEFKIIQSKILKAYYVKEEIIKRIVNEYRDNLKRSTDVYNMGKKAVIANINDLNNAYAIYKKDVYKKHLGLNRAEKKKIKPNFMHSYFLNKVEANIK